MGMQEKIVGDRFILMVEGNETRRRADIGKEENIEIIDTGFEKEGGLESI